MYVKNKDLIDNFLNLNGKNSFVYEKMLFEITNYFINISSPITAFTHLYRSLEFISYSFPMIYAAKSKDYKGTFDNLKKFFKNETNSELKFFNNFLEVLFDDEETTMKYKFDINIDMSCPLDSLKNDCRIIYNNIPYEFENGVLSIEFKNMLNFIVTTRNRYFHMRVGQPQENFMAIDYDINEYFNSINPFLLNWLSCIIQKVISFSFYVSITGS